MFIIASPILKFMKKIFCLALVNITQFSFGQDSIRLDSELSIETKGQHNLAAFASDFDCWNCITNKVQDNPFFHLAIYTGIDHKLVLNKKYTLETVLYLEERSHSGGNNTVSNIVVFPKILLQVKDTLTIGSKDFGVFIRGGDFWNEDIDDMMRLYNIDYQGIIAELRLNNWGLSFMTIGDLASNVGLDLPQTYRFALGYRNKGLRNLTSITLNELTSSPKGSHPTEADVNLSNFTRKTFSEHFNVETQVDMRINPELGNSLAIGLKANYKEENIKISSALRYYAAEFNFGYNGKEPNYSGFGDNYVGEQLYPLKNYYRNYSQWAAYTHLGPSDLIALEVTSSWEEKLYKKFGVFYDLDFNYIYDLDRDVQYFFPIYNSGIQVDFLSNFIGKISLTNKHMELRNYYQTFAVSRKPFISLGITVKIEPIRPKTVYVKS